MSIRTLLVDDYARIRKSLLTLLEKVPGVEFIGIIELDCSRRGGRARKNK